MNASNGSNVFSPMLIEFSVMRIDDFPYGTVHPRAPSDDFSGGVPLPLGEVRQEKYAKKKERKRREESPRKEREERGRKVEKNVMQSGKPCRSPFVRSHASY